MRARIEISGYELPLLLPMRTSAGGTNVRRGLLVRVCDEKSGIVGIGETAPLDADELARARSVLEAAEPMSQGIDRIAAKHPGALLSDVAAVVGSWLGPTAPPSARCGLETAFLDALGKREGRTVAELLGGSAGLSVDVNALITDEEANVAGARAVDFLARGFRTLKLKLGNPDTDRARIRSVLASVAPGRDSTTSVGGTVARVACTLRLDANQAWDFQVAAALASELDGMPIDYVEEPLADPIPHVLARLRRRSLVGIALDESVSTLADLERYAGANACDVLVVKLQRVGGPSTALQLAAAAHAKGLRVVFTDSLETAVGRAATLHCAAACTAEAVGLAGAFLMYRDGSGHDCPRVEICGPGLGVSA